MRIDLSDPRVSAAVEHVRQKHNISDNETLGKVFEEVYHCKLVADPSDPWCTNGWMDISEEKYATWFSIQFGEAQ